MLRLGSTGDRPLACGRHGCLQMLFPRPGDRRSNLILGRRGEWRKPKDFHHSIARDGGGNSGRLQVLSCRHCGSLDSVTTSALQTGTVKSLSVRVAVIMTMQMWMLRW